MVSRAIPRVGVGDYQKLKLIFSLKSSFKKSCKTLNLTNFHRKPIVCILNFFSDVLLQSVKRIIPNRKSSVRINH